MIVAPDGAAWGARRQQIDSTMVKALARAIRWRRMLENGAAATVAEIAATEMINASYGVVSHQPMCLLGPTP